MDTTWCSLHVEIKNWQAGIFFVRMWHIYDWHAVCGDLKSICDIRKRRKCFLRRLVLCLMAVKGIFIIQIEKDTRKAAMILF